MQKYDKLIGDISNHQPEGGSMYVIRLFTLSCLALVGIVAVGAVGGCSSEPKDPFADSMMAPQKYTDYVPPSARTVASGTGTLNYTATESGTLYLLDTSAMDNVGGMQKPKVLITGFVTPGNEVVVDPQAGRVHLKGRKGLAVKNMDPSHKHELRFDPSNKPQKM